MKWTIEWVIAWAMFFALTVAAFLTLEFFGLRCEWLDIFGCSTLSALLSNWPVYVSTATGSLCCILTIHWHDGWWRRHGKRMKMLRIVALAFLFALGYGAWTFALMRWGAG